MNTIELVANKTLVFQFFAQIASNKKMISISPADFVEITENDIKFCNNLMQVQEIFKNK